MLAGAGKPVLTTRIRSWAATASHPCDVPACRTHLVPRRLSTSSSGRASTRCTAVKHSDVVAVLRERGLVAEVTSDELGKACAAAPLSVYCGFDPTADSLHLGNLLGILVLCWFQRCGHTPVALLGGATGRVGDPSGRSTERPVLSENAIEHNVARIGSLLTSILTRSALSDAPPVKVVNNLDWFKGVGFLDFLRDVGKYARVSQMLAKDSVRTRLQSEQGISFTEFTYQLLQGYDFVHLSRHHGVRVQIGGSDQWGNIIAGTELIRKLPTTLGAAQTAPTALPAASLADSDGVASSSGEDAALSCYGLTFPLLVDAEGRKFGKSVGGAVWLSPDRLSPYQFYQHLLSTADADVIRFLRMLTFLPLDRVAEVEAAMAAPTYSPNTAQRLLAEEVTRFVHGDEGLQQALKATEALKPGSKTTLDAATLESVAAEAPSATLERSQVCGVQLVELMLTIGLMTSKGQGRKMIKGGGVYLNNQKVLEELVVVREEDLIDNRMLLVAAGKKNKMLVRVPS